MLKIGLIFLLALVAAPAFAIYKCESNGQVTYGDAACRGSKALSLENSIDTEVRASNVVNAKEQLAREKKEVTRLEKERHKREAAEEKEQTKIAKSDAVKRKRCSTLALRKKWADEDGAAATGKSREKAQRKARRAAETHQAECGK
jgi:hypothetical protein